MRWLALTLLFAGCFDDGLSSGHEHDVNDCSGAALTTKRCVTLHLFAGGTIPSGTELVQVDVWAHYTSTVSQAHLITTPMEKPTHFPIALGLTFPDELETNVQLFVEGLNGPGYVAYGTANTDPEPAQHLDVDVQMDTPATSGCFDHVFSSTTETDVDCGDNCPPCASGLRCVSGSDCQSASCVDVNDQFVCQ